MTNKKQISANQKNALLSTGPKTEAGKATTVLNPIKHGVFAKSIVVETGFGKENGEEYTTLLQNLIECLKPQNQMEALLVEKIAVDFWRLNRVFRFEMGSIQKYIEEAVKAFYDSYKNKTNEELEKEINEIRECLHWNREYLNCLREGIVSFDKPIWIGKDIESEIIEDFYIIANNVKYERFNIEIQNDLFNRKYSFLELRTLLRKNGISSDREFSEILIKFYEEKNRELKESIQKLEKQKLANREAEELFTKICSIPQNEDVNKILKYERSIQKSIFQNLLLLKKLQED